MDEEEEIYFCDYGCGKVARFTLKNGKHCCCSSYSSCDAIRKKNSEGLKRAYSKKRSPWDSWNGSKENLKVLKDAHDRRILQQMEEAFVKESKASNLAINNYLKNYKSWEQKCSRCGLTEWQGKPIPLELHHINGNNRDNRLENLEYLCLNCHAQTESFRGRNINNGKKKVEDSFLIEALSSSKNIREALLKVGLSPKGANYNRAYKLISQNNIHFPEKKN